MNAALPESPWLFCPRPVRDPAGRVFLFPHAGAGPSVYRVWPEYFPPNVEVCAVALPGREQRMAEPPFTHMRSLVQTLGDVLSPFFDVPFVLFGHSFGAAIAFELARAERCPMLKRVFVSGRRAPSEPATGVLVHSLPEEQLLARIRKMGGTPSIVLQDPELRALFCNIIRADFEVLETHEYCRGPLLATPITALCASADPHATQAQMAGWSAETSGEFRLHLFEGDHFFLHEAVPQISRLVTQEITQAV